MKNKSSHVAALLLLALVVGCKSKSDAAPEPAASSAVVPKEAPPPPEESPVEKIRKAPTLQAAFTLAQPDDSVEQLDRGSLLLTAWSTKFLQWSDVSVTKDETSYALVQKDPDTERAKRLCVSGSIIQIETNKVDWGKFYDGLLLTYGQSLYRFMAVKSSGALVQGSQARFCGVVTGKYDYSNSGGGTGHAVAVVGMFDLPENKK